jgi:hypothetical protein
MRESSAISISTVLNIFVISPSTFPSSTVRVETSGDIERVHEPIERILGVYVWSSNSNEDLLQYNSPIGEGKVTLRRSTTLKELFIDSFSIAVVNVRGIYLTFNNYSKG